VTGVSIATKAAVSTSARATVARIMAIPPDLDPSLSECLSSVAFVGQTQTGVPQNDGRRGSQTGSGTMPRSFWHLADDARRLPSPAPTRSSNNEKQLPLLALYGHDDGFR
jgi:hypothetical protein